MILKKRIPEEFYKIFRTKNRDAYMTFLVALYEENNRLVSSFGLTEEEGRAVINEVIGKSQILWQVDEQELEENDTPDMFASPTTILNRFVRWGWLRSNYDEKINRNMISFPEYSQLYVELFEKMECADDSKERESILSIYSALFTYSKDEEKDNRILENALNTSRSLSMMLSNMQDGMRSYFEELSSRKNFIGIQKVLVEEINNNDSRKYAILTTSDSFYRYKENVKELISRILRTNEEIKEQLERDSYTLEEGSLAQRRNAFEQERVERASQYVYRIEREFDQIEKKYNKLINQKTVFAKRALARIHYILQEGTDNEDALIQLIRVMDNQTGEQEEKLLCELRKNVHFSTSFRQITDKSFYLPRAENSENFIPIANNSTDVEKTEIQDFVPKPLYTHQELNQFRQRNMQNGRFVATPKTVQSAQDLEKLLLIWQDATDNRLGEDRITLGEEIRNEDGFSFSQLTIDDK